jgi:hypothetical protein
MSDHADLRHAEVRCRECGKEYVCTPDQDYFNATNNTDGLCWDCLMAEQGLKAQPEPEVVSVPVPSVDEVIGIKLIGGPKPLDGWNNAYRGDQLGGWPPPEELAAFNIGGVVAVAKPEDVPEDMSDAVTLYRKVKQSKMPKPGSNIFRGATYQAVE